MEGNSVIFIIVILLLVLFVLLYFLIKSNKKYNILYSEVEREYKPIVDINEEIQRKNMELKKIENEIIQENKKKELERLKK